MLAMISPSSSRRLVRAAHTRQSGFTLIEILVALALITLLAVGISLSFDGSRSKAQALLNNMSELASANIRLKNDVGCYGKAPAALTSTSGFASYNLCGVTTAPATWNGPYVGVFAADASGAVQLPKVAPNVVITFNSATGDAANPYGASGTDYTVEASGLPSDIVTQALQECNGSTTAGGGYANAKCEGDPTNGKFYLLYDQTR